jgi:hypothetical protein
MRLGPAEIKLVPAAARGRLLEEVQPAVEGYVVGSDDFQLFEAVVGRVEDKVAFLFGDDGRDEEAEAAV